MKSIEEIAKELFPMEVGNVTGNSYQSEKRRAFIQGYEFFTQNNSFETVVQPVIGYLIKNHDPHTIIQIDSRTAQIYQGQKRINLNW